MLQIDLLAPIKWIIENLKSSWPTARALLLSYIRLRQIHRHAFLFLSQGASGPSLKVSVALLLLCVSTSMIWLLIFGSAIGEPMYKTIFLFIRTYVILSALWISVSYALIRWLFGRRLGFFLINISAVSQIWITALMLGVTVVGAAASGSLYDDILQVRNGGGRDTAFYHVACEPIELILQEEVLRSNIEKQLAHAKVNGFSESGPWSSHNVLVNLNNLKILLKKISSIDIEDHFWQAFNEYSAIFIMFTIDIIVLGALVFWNFAFLASALRAREPGWNGAIKAVGKVAVVLLAALPLVYIYVQAAEGTPTWERNGDARQLQQARAQARRVQPFCGHISDKFEATTVPIRY